MTTVTNLSDLSPTMRTALLSDRPGCAKRGTREGLVRRGLIDENWNHTDAGRRVADQIRDETTRRPDADADAAGDHLDHELTTEPMAEARSNTVTVALPRSLADQLEAAWDEAYRSGDEETKTARFTVLAQAYLALSEVTPNRALSRAFRAAHYHAIGRADSWSAVVKTKTTTRLGEEGK